MKRCQTCAIGLSHCRGMVHPRDCEHVRSGVPGYAEMLRSLAPSGRSLAPPLGEWDYVTTSRLIEDSARLQSALPPDVDLVVAVARSGLLPGQAIASGLHRPLWTVSPGRGLIDPGAGFRMIGFEVNGVPIRHILLIDDTVASGKAMREVLPHVRARFPGAKVTRAAIYCHPASLGSVDLTVSVYPGHHYLEWNFCNAGHGERMASDFDGILCRDFTPGECRSDATYRAAMARIEPRFLPRRSIVPLVVTGRPESTRSISLDWLDRHGVRVERLVMWPGEAHPTSAEVAPWKARYYRESDCVLFAESDPCQAEAIARSSGKAVLCPAAGKVFPPRSAKPRGSLADAIGSGR